MLEDFLDNKRISLCLDEKIKENNLKYNKELELYERNGIFFKYIKHIENGTNIDFIFVEQNNILKI